MASLAHKTNKCNSTLEDLPAVVIFQVDAHSDVKCTFGELCDAFRQVAGGLLQLGVRPGDSIGFHCSNGTELVVGLCGTFLTGGTAVFAKTNLTAGILTCFDFLNNGPISCCTFVK